MGNFYKPFRNSIKASSALIGGLSGAFSGGGAYTAGTVVQSAKNYDLKNKFGFNPLNSQKGVMFFDGNVMSEGKTKLNVQNVKNQMSLTQKAQLSNIEASEIVKSHNDMMSKITPQILRNLNYANKLTNGNIIVARGNLDAVNPTLGLEETDAGNSNGYYDAPSNSIVLNFDKIGDAEYIFNSVLTHEMTHSAESSQHYQALSDYVLKDIFGDITTQEGKLALENAQKKKISEYYKKSNGKTKLSFEEAKKEIVAQRMAEMLNNPQSGYSALTELANHDLATARGIVNTIKDTYNKIKDKLTHNEGRYYAKFTNFTQYEEAINLFEKAVRDGVKHSEVNANNKVQFDIGYTTDKLPVVMLKDNIFDGKTGKPHEVISNFIADQIGNGYDISESGQKVYIGEDLPNEYTQSEYTKWILKNRSNLLKVKNQSAQNIKEIIEIATDRRWDKNTKAKHNVDAKYGFYKYTSRVALPVKDSNGNIVRSNIYDVELVIRNDADGKKYLYDIQNINKSVKQLTSTWNSKSVIQAQHSNDIVPQKKIPVNTNSTQNSENYAYSDGNVQNNAMSEALAKAGLTDNTKNDFTDYSDYRNSDNGNVGLLDRDTEGVNKNEAVDNENGAVDNDDTKFRTKKAEDYYKKAVNTLRKSLSKAFNITNLRNDTRVNEIIKAVAKNQLQTGEIDAEGIDTLFDELYSKGENLDNFHAKKDFYNALADFSKKLDDLYKYKNGKLNKPSDVLEDSPSVDDSEENKIMNNSDEIEYLNSNDREKYMRTGNQHSQHKKTALVENGIDPLLQSAESMETFISDSLNGKLDSQIRAFSKANEQMRKDVYDATDGDIDIQDYYLELNSDDIYHLNDHINEKNKEQKPLSVNEINNLPQYMVYYDDLIDVHRQKDGRMMMVVGKRINGHSIVISIVSSGRKSLILKTAYNISTEKYDSIVNNKKSAKPQETTESLSETMPNTSNNVPTIALSGDSIPNDNNIVKENASTVNNNLEQSKEDYLMEAYEKKRTLQKDYEKALKNILLSEQDRVHLERWVKGEIKEEHIPPEANIEGIKELYKYRSAIENENQKIKQYNAIRKENLHKRADSLLENSDNWKEKKIPVLYEVETMKRNIRSMVNDKATADSIIDEYFIPVHDYIGGEVKFYINTLLILRNSEE